MHMLLMYNHAYTYGVDVHEQIAFKQYVERPLMCRMTQRAVGFYVCYTYNVCV